MKRKTAKNACNLCKPTASGEERREPEDSFFALSSGYLKRAEDRMPKIGQPPFDIPQDVLKDIWRLYIVRTLPEQLLFEGRARL